MKKLREILKTADNWCQGRMATTEDCVSCNANSPEAKRFCLIGAISAASGEEVFATDGPAESIKRALREALRKRGLSLGKQNIIKFNDAADTTFQDVCSVIAEAFV